MTRSQTSDQLRADPTTPARRKFAGAAACAIAVIATAGLATGCGSANATTEPSGTASTPAAKHSSQAPNPADEICEEMIQTAVDGQLGTGSLIGEPVLAKSGNVTTCTYKVTGGVLVMSVGEHSNDATAQAAFDNTRSASTDAERVPNLGEAAFTDAAGTTVTIKDNKVLTVDPTELPTSNDKTQIAQSLSFAVLTCWTH